MSFSIQTNVNSLIAQENLRVNSNFQSQTIQRLTSGYRINSSADDAAGLAIANKFRSDTAELSQGVRNANDGISTMQIIDGGMNNISKMLDRLRTLATQSASATFTGTRSTVDTEFQSLLTEIDRQAQSIGLSEGGQFAKSLSVFIGGGRTVSGDLSTANGTVSLDLTKSAVDTRNLGLSGMQAVAGSADLSVTSATSVAKIATDATNKASESTPGSTIFYFTGSGFADTSKMAVSVNLSGVTDAQSLANAINTGVQNAANGSTPAATAFKAAGIVSSVHTNVNGAQQIAFTSSNSAFQVQAGDQMSNAIMGNFSTGAAGKSTATTITGQAVNATGTTPMTANDVLVKISGAGMASPVTLTLDKTTATVDSMVSDLTTQVGAQATLKAAGITAAKNSSGQIVFTNSQNQQFNVEVTGDKSNNLGLGSFLYSGAGNADYGSIAAATNYDAGGTGALTNATAGAEATMEFSIGGGPSVGIAGISLAGGNATESSVRLAAISSPVTIKTGDNDVLTFSIDGNTVSTTLTSDGTAGSALGTTQFKASGDPGFAATDVHTGDNTFLVAVDGGGPKVVTIAGNEAALTATTTGLFTNGAGSVDITTLNNTFKLNDGTGSGDKVVTLASDHAVAQGGHSFATAGVNDLNVTTGNNTFTIDVGSGAQTVTLAKTEAAVTAVGGLFAGSATVDITTGSNDTFTLNVDGQGSQTVTLAQDHAYDKNTIVAALNTSILNAGFSATASMDAAGNLSITSNKPDSTGSNVTLTAIGGSSALTDLGFTGTVNVTGTAGYNSTSIAGALNTAFASASGGSVAGAVHADVVNNKVVLTSVASGAAATFTLGADGSSSLLSDLGLGEGVSKGQAKYDSTNVVQRVQAGIDAQGLQAKASLDGSGNLVLRSNACGTAAHITVKTDVGTALTQMGFVNNANVGGTAGYDKAGMLAAVNAGLSAAGLGNIATLGGTNSNQILITSGTSGQDSVVSIGQNGSSTGALTALGLSVGTNTGTDGSDATKIAGEIQSAINLAKTATGGAGGTAGALYASGASATVTVDNLNRISITNDHAGASHSVNTLAGNATTGGTGTNWGAGADAPIAGLNRDGADMANAINLELGANATLKAAGLTASYAGQKLTITGTSSFRMNAGAAPVQGSVVGTVDLSKGADFTASPMSLQVSVDGKAATTVTLNQKYATAALLATAIQSQLTNVAASVVTANGKQYLQLAATTAGIKGSVQVQSGGTANATLGLTDSTVKANSAQADLGFGVSNKTTAGSLGLEKANSSLSVVNANGTSQTGAIAFTALTNAGGKTQALAISANDAGGSMQSVSITLAATGAGTTALGNEGSGDNIDQAVSYVNSQLQKTNNATLQQIVAVKQTVDGNEEINFMSSSPSFQVGVGSATNKEGLNAGVAQTATGVLSGSGSTVSVLSQSDALAAVNAVAAAITKLGSAQAAVGKGQNQLNYAVNLAQSQISNFSAAESRIRDADVASEAANLTKAQVLQQASMAAMAQANSAPQAVMALLRG